MDSAAGDRARLAQLIRTRRLKLRLSIRSAAKLAEIAQNTWSAAEKGSQRTAEYNYAGIERALRWAPGSFDAMLAGGEPVPLEVRTDAPAGDRAVVEQIIMILDSEFAAGFSAETKLGMIRDVIARDYVPNDVVKSPAEHPERRAVG